MFTKLFNNISPRNLFNVILVLLLVASSYWFFPVEQWQWYPKEAWGWPMAGPLIAFVAFLVLMISGALFFAESQNRRHNFEGQYLNMLIFGVLFWLWIYPLNAGPHIWALVLFAGLVSLTIPLLRSEAATSALSYSAGLLISLGSFLNAETIALVLIPFLVIAAVRRLNGRSFLALMLGLSSGIYFAFSLDFLLDTNFMSAWMDEMQAFELFHFRKDFQRLAVLIPIALFLILSLLITLAQSSHYNNEQRKEVNYWSFLALIGLSGFILFQNSNFWLGLCLWPTASLATRAVQGLHNPWLKDGLLMIPFIAYLATFFI